MPRLLPGAEISLRNRVLTGLTLVFLAGAGLFLWLTQPHPLPRTAAFDQPGDPVAGGRVFWAGGCASCHVAPNSGEEDRLKLAGGQKFNSAFGTFVAPNISPHPQAGIGDWDAFDLANALMRGISPDGAHYYPSLPYVSYAGMKVADVIDLKAFLDTLPPVAEPAPTHDLPLIFRLRRSVGMWKFLFFRPGEIVTDAPDRGRYLVEVLGHCGECHTPRNFLGAMNTDLWLSGAPNPDGEGKIPNITSHADGIGRWSAAEIAFFLDSGMTPDFDMAAGSMRSVIANMQQLDEADRLAIAEYLLSVPAIASE